MMTLSVTRWIARSRSDHSAYRRAALVGAVRSRRPSRPPDRSAAVLERRRGEEGDRRCSCKRTTTQGSPKFVPPEERIATFDQDGTLWVEHPMYSQVMYCLERVPAVVKAKPELQDVEPFKTVLSGDREAMAKLTDAGPRKDPRRHAHRHDRGRVQRRSEEVDRRRPRTRAGSGPTPNSPTSRCRRC